MKSNSFWGLIFNPFTRIAGWQAFVIGIIISGLTGIVGTLSGVVFDGVLDAHTGPDINYLTSFVCLGVDIVSIVLVMWLAALIVSRDFRFIDIFGTMTIACAPMLPVAFAAFFAPAPPDPAALITDPASFMTPGSIIFMLIAIGCIIWHIALIYNAMKVSCNIGGAKLALRGYRVQNGAASFAVQADEGGAVTLHPQPDIDRLTVTCRGVEVFVGALTETSAFSLPREGGAL